MPPNARLIERYFKQTSAEISKMFLSKSLQYTQRSFESVLIKFLRKENYTRFSVESPCFDRGDHKEKLGEILSIITYASFSVICLSCQRRGTI